jgi:AcrR family transcriptional regulator
MNSVAAGHSSEPRPLGRPRKTRSTSHLAPRDEILASAAELFAGRGVADVSMSEIAQNAGLGQSSLYYWFRRKELIVAELLHRINRLPLEFARSLAAFGASPAVQLWQLVRFDVLTVCDLPLEITEVHRLAARHPDAFATYWEERGHLTDAVEALVRRGITDGTFRAVDPRLCALTLLAQDESVQNWYREPGPGGSPAAADRAARSYRAEDVAEFIADQTVRGLLARPAELDRVRRGVQGRD